MRDTSLVYPVDGQGRVLLGRKKTRHGIGKVERIRRKD